MNRVTVDETLRNQLDGIDAPVEVCDESGQTLGRFVPERLFQQHQLELDGCPHSAEELEGMHAETGGRSLAEIWQRLGRQ
jgi:hypothetical protein